MSKKALRPYPSALRRPMRRHAARLFLELLEDRNLPSSLNGLETDDDFWVNMEWLKENRGTLNSPSEAANREAERANGPDHTLSPPGALDPLANNNAGSTGTAGFTQSETTVVAFGSTVVVGFNDSGSNFITSNKFTGFAYSTDGGTTFTDGGELPTSTNGDVGDPVLARDNTTGRIYYATLQFSGAGINVFRSDTNGVSWTAPVQGAPGKSGFQDKQWLTVDNFAGSGNGNVYLAVRDFGSGGGIYFFRSTNNGDSFGPSGGTLIASAGSGNVQGAFVTVGADHSVYVFYFDNTTATQRIMVRKSTDQGASFAPAVTVATLSTTGVNGDQGLVGIRDGTSTASGFRSNAFPHADVNPVNGHLYVTYADNPAGVDKADVYFQMSTDGGDTWTSPVRVNSDATTTDQWQPTIAASTDGARVGVFYYSRQEDTANNNFKYYGSLGIVSGSTVTFQPNFAVSDTASPPEFGRDSIVNSQYMGDYNQAAATPGYFHVTWSDNRSGLPGGGTRMDPNVYYQKIPLGLVVASTTPAAGAIVIGATPASYVVSFSDPINAGSLDAGDFTVNSIAANDVSLNGAGTQATFLFDTDPISGQGLQTMAIAAGAITRQSDGSEILPFDANFRYDAQSLTVESTDPPVGSAIALGGGELVYVVDFSDDTPIAASSVGLADLMLSAGVVLSANKTGDYQATYLIGGLTTEQTWNVTIAAGALTDENGNPNAAFSGEYYLDFGTVAYPTPLGAVAPLGSLIYDPSVSAAINPAGDTDSFTITVGAGQTITALVTPTDSGLRPMVEVVGLGSNTAAAAGKKALLQTAPTGLGGDFTVIVSGVGGTTGGYTLELTANAALENESNDGLSNNTPASAQDIDGSFVTLQTSVATAYRGAVLGQGDDDGATASPTLLDGFEAKSALQNFTFLGSKNASITTSASHDGKNGLQVKTFTEWMYRNDAAAQVGRGDIISVWVKAKGTPSGRAYFGFGATAFGTLSMVMAPNTNQLIIQNNAGYGFSDIGSVPQTWAANTWYLFKINWKANGDIVGQLYASNGTTLLNTVTAHNETVLGGGIAFRAFGDAKNTTYFFDTVQKAAFTPNPDYYAFTTASAGERVTVTLNRLSGSGPLSVDLRNSAGTVLATSSAGPTNVDQIIYNAVAGAAGTYYVRVNLASGEYSLTVNRNAVFDAEANNTLATAQDMTGNQGALGSLSGGAVTITLNAADSGWWDQSGFHDSGNKNYLVGQLEGTGYRDYFVFNLASVTQPILGAQLIVTNPAGGFLSDDPFETYTLFDVSTPTAALQGSGSGQTGIFADLGSGSSYGSKSVSFADDDSLITLDLNAAALTYLNSALGSLAALGGAITTLSGSADQYLFGFSGSGSDIRQLVLDVGPPEDWYKVTLGAGQTTLDVETSTPGDGPGEIGNTLDPHIELYTSGGALVDSGAALGDGRNEFIHAIGLTPGATYYIRILPENGSSGEYFLDPPLASALEPLSDGDPLALGLAGEESGPQKAVVATIGVGMDGNGAALSVSVFASAWPQSDGQQTPVNDGSPANSRLAWILLAPGEDTPASSSAALDQDDAALLAWREPSADLVRIAPLQRGDFVGRQSQPAANAAVLADVDAHGVFADPFASPLPDLPQLPDSFAAAGDGMADLAALAVVLGGAWHWRRAKEEDARDLACRAQRTNQRN